MPPHLAGHVAMLAFSAAVAGSFALGGLVANLIDPAVLTVARFWLAAGMLAAVAVATGQMNRRVARSPWRYLLLGGLMGVYFVTMFECLKTAPPVTTSAIFTLTPLMAAGFGWVLLRQRTSRRMALALAIGGVGALWVIFRADWQALVALDLGRGEAIFFVGVAAHALYTPLVAMFKRGEGLFAFACGTMIGGAVVLTLYSGRQIVQTDWAALPAIVWITMAYLAVFGSAVSFALHQFAATRLPSAKVMAYTYLTPTWVICWQLALGEAPPRPLVLAGIGLTALALVLLLRHEHPGDVSVRARRV